MIYLKIAFLFFGIMFTLVNITLVKFKSDIPIINFVVQAAGITGFIVLQWII